MIQNFIIALGLLMLCLWSNTVHAQENDISYTTVYLNDGSKITGQIVEWQYGDYIKLELGDGVVTTIPNRDIRKVESDVVLKGSKTALKENELFFELGGLFINGNEGFRFEGQEGYAVNGAANYRWNHWLGAGIGLGFFNYVDAQKERFLPIYGQVQGTLSERLPTMNYKMAIGYGINLTPKGQTTNTNRIINDAKGGYYIHPSIGLLLGSDVLKFNFSVGYAFQDAQYDYNFAWETTERLQNVTYKRITFALHTIF